MKIFSVLLLFFLVLFVNVVKAERITIAAAADLKFAMDEIVYKFNKQNTNDKVEVIYGSSGKLYAQIREGAPYDIFFSADINYARELKKENFAASEVKAYAIGRIVLWSASLDVTSINLESLNDPKIKRIAIANPKHAPYGKRAEEALRAASVWEKIESKLVYGENISQAAQFVESGNADIGIIALSLALSPILASKGHYWLIPDNLHKPLEQGFIITKRAEASRLARRFSDYMSDTQAQIIMEKYGFVIPAADDLLD